MTYDDQQVLVPRAPRTVTVAVSLLFLAAICMIVDGVFVLSHLSTMGHAAFVSAQDCVAQKKTNCGTPQAAEKFEKNIELAIGIILIVLGLALGLLARASTKPVRRIRTAMWAVALVGLICFGCGGFGAQDVTIPDATGRQYSEVGKLASYLLLLGSLGLLIGLVLLFLPSTRGFYSGIPYVPKGQPVVGDLPGGSIARSTTSTRPGASRTAVTRPTGAKTTGAKTTGAKAPAKTATAGAAKKTAPAKKAVPPQVDPAEDGASPAPSETEAGAAETTD